MKNATSNVSNKIKKLSVVVSIVYVFASVPLIIHYIAMLLCILSTYLMGEQLANEVLLRAFAYVTLVFAVSIFLIVSSIKKSIKTNEKRHLWVAIIAVIFVLFIQLIFKASLFDIWNDMFRPIYSSM